MIANRPIQFHDFDGVPNFSLGILPNIDERQEEEEWMEDKQEEATLKLEQIENDENVTYYISSHTMLHNEVLKERMKGNI